ncbi:MULTISPECIES: superinfection immunity protein [Shewanella]|uniref:Superinfection immunity protein n=1 Tax=Shewanella fidelis TaxID=173509 RepID=A0AAW8NRQ2_9GAMM|nr:MULTISPECIES: superinfection immunity protein [Shewanella]MDR8525793.1 superinfection immunity protein [Shewanella fidelis]MDW4812698.1 superinfection immunity protein [Shewanella fidelis]MDW4816446.1 superinfection immunity protein [Shewanella fidelis]MDW4820390.1 superinfection immunity protein [Shewanella fidelis]MDW4825162.1 superinfection immunity protein [Shewanella fidelis]
MEFIDKILTSDNTGFMLLLGLVVVVLWFLPAMLALVFNRKHFKLILLACIPAGFSLIAWGGVMLWATTGKVVDKYANRATPHG